MTEASQPVIAVDLGGTKARVALVRDGEILRDNYQRLPASIESYHVVIDLLISMISEVSGSDGFQSIGIGVPSIVDREGGIVFEVQNIPHWEEVHLGPILEKQFSKPVYLENDGNCFALGEHRYGVGKGSDSLVGLVVGTGLGAGIISRGKLLDDSLSGSGEFGMIPFRDGILEDYCSGKFFKNFHDLTGEECARLAEQGDKRAQDAFNEYGKHLGMGIKLILHTLDPKLIIIGGSGALSNQYFDASMRETILEFPYQQALRRLSIKYSRDNDSPLLGASLLTN